MPAFSGYIKAERSISIFHIYPDNIDYFFAPPSPLQTYYLLLLPSPLPKITRITITQTHSPQNVPTSRVRDSLSLFDIRLCVSREWDEGSGRKNLQCYRRPGPMSGCMCRAIILRASFQLQPPSCHQQSVGGRFSHLRKMQTRVWTGPAAEIGEPGGHEA